jgi:hypothetical protein
MTLFEISTEDKILRTCAENEDPIRGSRGDSEMAFEKLSSLIEMPISYKKHIQTGIDTLLFNNPSFKKFAPYITFTENAIDFNLQPRLIPYEDDFYSNFYNELYNKLPLSIYENVNLKEIDNYSK